MTWSVERVGSALHVSIATPMTGEWDTLLDDIKANLEPKPLAIHIPPRCPALPRTTKRDFARCGSRSPRPGSRCSRRPDHVQPKWYVWTSNRCPLAFVGVTVTVLPSTLTRRKWKT